MSRTIGSGGSPIGASGFPLTADIHNSTYKKGPEVLQVGSEDIPKATLTINTSEIYSADNPYFVIFF